MIGMTMTKVAKAAVLAVALGGATLSALPAQAAGPEFGFSFQFGTGGDFFPRHPQRIMCLTDYQVRQAVAAYGYNRIYLNVGEGKYIQVKASKGSRTYLLKFNRCTGQIVERMRIR